MMEVGVPSSSNAEGYHLLCARTRVLPGHEGDPGHHEQPHAHSDMARGHSREIMSEINSIDVSFIIYNDEGKP